MGDGLDYWDRPRYPACKDPRCSAVAAGIPHVVDESHQGVLDTLGEWQRDMGDRPPRVERSEIFGPSRSLYLRAEDMKHDRQLRLARLIRIAGLSVMGVGLLLLVVSVLMLGGE